MIKRKAAYPIEKSILERWSPRAMSGAPISHHDLMMLFEAARWAPSSYNAQPWRVLYAFKNTPYWDIFFNLLVPFNQSWACNAGALVLFISRKTFAFNNKVSRTHSFDTGAASLNFALQASIMGLVVHGMEGFDYERARIDLNVPDGYAIEAMYAVGHPGPLENLPKELLEREVPSDRKHIQEWSREGVFDSSIE